MHMKYLMAALLLAVSSAFGANAQAIDWKIFTEPFISSAHAQTIEWQKIDDIFGRKPAVSGEVHRYGFPRSDLSVTLDGVTIKPPLALGGWIAFMPMHNHLLRASPASFYMHVGGRGDPVKMAAVIRDALAASKTPLTPTAASAPPAVDLDTAQLDQIIGAKGQNNGGVYAFAVPRRDPISEGGMQLAPVGPMGVAQAINFQPTGGSKAAITGDFVLTGDEVNPVIKALKSNDIDVTAIHSHMLSEQPRLFFLHFWAVDDAVKLAKGLRAALDKTASTMK